MEHLTDKDIDAYVQHKKGNQSYFSLTKERLDETNVHLKNCNICSKKIDESEKLYDSIKLNKGNNWYQYIAAAVVLISFTFYGLNGSELNEDYFLSYQSFNKLVFFIIIGFITFINLVPMSKDL